MSTTYCILQPPPTPAPGSPDAHFSETALVSMCSRADSEVASTHTEFCGDNAAKAAVCDRPTAQFSAVTHPLLMLQVWDMYLRSFGGSDQTFHVGHPRL